MIEVHPKMDMTDARLIMERHEMGDSFITRRIATVLGGLEAEIAALQAQCESYAAELIGERGENARLTALVAKMEQYATSGEWSEQNLAQEAALKIMRNTPV